MGAEATNSAEESEGGRRRGRPKSVDATTQSLTAILQLVRANTPLTRQEIERDTELGRAIVSARLSSLSELSMIDESELGTASGGRAPRLVRFRSEAARILVATLDQTAIGIGVADLSGQLLMEHHEAMDLALGPAVVLERLCALFDWVLQKHRGGIPVWGIGLSTPGPVPEAGDSLFPIETPAFLPGWDNFPFVEKLVKRYQAPVWMRSSVETMTVGEFNAGAGAKDMLFVKVGKRIGAGIIFNGQLYRGAQGAAGLIGQSPARFGEEGGTIDALAGSDYIAREGKKAAAAGTSPYLADIVRRGGEINAIEVGQAAQTGDAASITIMSRAGHVLGHNIAVLANLLNPALIVLSGSIAQADDILLAAVREAVYGESHPLVTRDLRILRSQLGSSAGLVGAASVVADALFETATLRNWILRGSPLQHPDFVAVLASANSEAPNPARDAPIAPNPTSVG